MIAQGINWSAGNGPIDGCLPKVALTLRYLGLPSMSYLFSFFKL